MSFGDDADFWAKEVSAVLGKSGMSTVCHICKGPSSPYLGGIAGHMPSYEYELFWTMVQGERVLLCSGCVYQRDKVQKSVDDAWERNRW